MARLILCPPFLPMILASVLSLHCKRFRILHRARILQSQLSKFFGIDTADCEECWEDSTTFG